MNTSRNGIIILIWYYLCYIILILYWYYIKAILSDIISDTSKFKNLSADPMLLREGQLQRFLRNIKNKKIFKKEVYDKICRSGSKLSSIYGLPKIHKLNVQRNK